MQVIRGLSSLGADWSGGIVALGFYDGVHKGHQEILRRAFLLREEISLPVCVFTFDKHPLEVVRRSFKKGTGPPKLLTTLEEKIQLMGEHDVDYLLIGEFTDEFSQISPEKFIDDILCGKLSAKVVVAGFNYRFGHRHRGDMELLMNGTSQCKFKVVVVPPVYDGDSPVSSTMIRNLIITGKTMEVEPLLCRWYSVHGTVVKGEGRGQLLGFPTANLSIPREKLIPKNGVYAAVVRRGETFYPGIMNIGVRPTFGEKSLTVEVHFLDVSLELYGEQLEVFCLSRLRPERQFQNKEALQLQIAKDINKAKHLMFGKLF